MLRGDDQKVEFQNGKVLRKTGVTQLDNIY